MKTLAKTTFILLLFQGCSSTADFDPKSSLKKISATNADAAPNLYIDKEQRYRAPASRKVARVQKNLSKEEVYFATLWQQKNDFEKILGQTSTTFICPGYHQTLVKNQEGLRSRFYGSEIDRKWKEIIGVKDPSKNPLLGLKVYGSDKDLYEAYVTEKDEFSKEVFKKALTQHYLTTKNEIETLCEYGSSDGQYVYLNMITHFSDDKQFKKSKQSLKAYWNLLTIENYAILSALSFQKLDQFGYEYDFLKKLKNARLEGYLYKIKLDGDNRLKVSSLGD